MFKSVTTIGTKVSSIEEARSLFRHGRSMEALHALRSFSSLEAAIVRARVLTRMDRLDEARQECLRFDIDGAPVGMVAESFLVYAQVELSARRFAAAAALIDDARVYVFSSADSALEADLLLLEARSAYAGGDQAATLERARAVLEVCEPFDLPSRVSPTIGLATSKARACELLGFTAFRRGDLATHLEHLGEAVSILANEPDPDVCVAAAVLANYANVAREIDPTAARREAIAAMRTRIGWTAENSAANANILHSLGWMAALQGDHLGALRSFREAGKLSRDPVDALRSHLDRAYLATELGQDLLAAEEVAEGLEMVKLVDWQAPAGEAYVNLIMLAQLVASSDPALAEELVEMYEMARSRTGREYHSTLEPRMRAMELFALAKIALARGDRENATTGFESARAIWSEVGCVWRAGLAAAELARLGAGSLYEDLARKEAESRPNSFFAKTVLGIAV